ncbi:hypothetical protein ACFY2K_10380 [Kitasatospora sp. NPDC001309]|uniref:hypothetical protein n=1 Tax=Kitasatospora sp. NPDC001309 TaxID=3364013 RepID=UPI0036C4E473
MIRTTRVHPVVVAGVSALLLAACGPADPAPSTQPSAKAAAPDGTAPSTTVPSTAGPGPTNTVVISGSSGGTYEFTGGACLGKESPSGNLLLMATGGPDGKAMLTAVFDGKGEMILTVAMDKVLAPSTVTWGGKAEVGEKAGRTRDVVTFTDLPVSRTPDAAEAKASGSLKCDTLGPAML